jgi:hypothetical protein
LPNEREELRAVAGADRFEQAWGVILTSISTTGGKDNGAPGLRPEYGDNYYAAFVISPDGHNIEAVTKRAV